MAIERIIWIVLDSLGVGELPDAVDFGDQGANTLLNIKRKRGRLDLPNLCSLGLGRIVDLDCPLVPPLGCFGKMAEKAPGKDTTSGHWELAGLALERPFPTYPQGFPKEVIRLFEKGIGRKTIGNYPRSGTVILDELGEEHLETGRPIVYTSADSVFQIATHEEIIPLEELYGFSRVAREILVGKHSVARVIARPFSGEPGRFERNNAGRRDFSIQPPGKTLLDHIKEDGQISIGLGKIGSIFGHKGFTEETLTNDNQDGLEKIVETMDRTRGERGLLFANLVDFDMVFGHRRNVEGYARALESFDLGLERIVDSMEGTDLLVITADHGCDPTFHIHTDHTREYVPILVFGKSLKKGVDLGIRETFADCGQTLADLLGVGPLEQGTSFKKEILDD
jgi:phosphopentomutase